MNTYNRKFVIGALLVVGLWQTNLHAKDVIMYDRPPSAEEMGNILFSKPSSAGGLLEARPKIKTRSISFGKTEIPEPDLNQAKAIAEEKNSIGLPIKFGYDSTEILPESLPFLDEVGKMLGMAEYAGEKLVVEGHTDASGSQAYNQYLSERRAMAVKTYLTRNFNINGIRLTVNGMGESQPLKGFDPFAAVNRRVQFYRAR